MHIVARQQHDLASTDHETLAVLALNPDMKLALDDVVIKDQVGRRPEHRRKARGPRREDGVASAETEAVRPALVDV